jgi:hypothetical protein
MSNESIVLKNMVAGSVVLYSAAAVAALTGLRLKYIQGVA